jgi:hypothetical protein
MSVNLANRRLGLRCPTVSAIRPISRHCRRHRRRPFHAPTGMAQARRVPEIRPDAALMGAACETILFAVCSNGLSILRNELSWLIRSSSRRKPARPKTSARPLVLATESFSRPRDICSTCSSQRMLSPPGSAGRRSYCGRKAFTALARQRAETRPLSSKPFVTHCAQRSGFGSPPIVIARVSLSVRKFSSITSTAAK